MIRLLKKGVVLTLILVFLSPGCGKHYEAEIAKLDTQARMYEAYVNATVEAYKAKVVVDAVVVEAKASLILNKRLEGKKPLVSVSTSLEGVTTMDMDLSSLADMMNSGDELTGVGSEALVIAPPKTPVVKNDPVYKAVTDTVNTLTPIGAIWATGAAVKSIAKAVEGSATTYTNSHNTSDGNQTIADGSSKDFITSGSHNDGSVSDTHNDKSDTGSNNDSSDGSIEDSHDDSSNNSVVIEDSLKDQSDTDSDSNNSTEDSHDDSSNNSVTKEPEPSDENQDYKFTMP
jgi:hypothetical protein